MLTFLKNLLKNPFRKKKQIKTKKNESVKITGNTITITKDDMRITLNSNYNIATIESNKPIDKQEAQTIINEIIKKYPKTNWENKNE